MLWMMFEPGTIEFYLNMKVEFLYIYKHKQILISKILVSFQKMILATQVWKKALTIKKYAVMRCF